MGRRRVRAYSCELKHALAVYSWTSFVRERMLKTRRQVCGVTGKTRPRAEPTWLVAA